VAPRFSESSQLTQFSELSLAAPILKALAEADYEAATPIQAQVIPAMTDGHDVLGVAQTGTGKTAAFVLPLLQKIVDNAAHPVPKGCSALILAPTRELASQIADSIKVYGRHIRHSRTVIVGGAKPGPQIRAMARGIDIVVATPGRLMDHMQSGAIRLDQTHTVVLDEADQMMDLGFLPAIRKILARTSKDRQTVLLSATMPKQIRSLAKDFLSDPVEVSVAPQSTPIERIEQKVLLVQQPQKGRALLDILKNNEVKSAIVFTRTKRGADKVNRMLQQADIQSEALHGNKSQGQRTRALNGFREGRISILVATDIAARGIDVDGITHVFNYELPNIPESYVHRIGRTARAGKSGIAISFCDSGERDYLRDIERLIGMRLLNADDDADLEKRAPSSLKGRGGQKSGSKSKSPSKGKRPNKPKARAAAPAYPEGQRETVRGNTDGAGGRARRVEGTQEGGRRTESAGKPRRPARSSKPNSAAGEGRSSEGRSNEGRPSHKGRTEGKSRAGAGRSGAGRPDSNRSEGGRDASRGDTRTRAGEGRPAGGRGKPGGRKPSAAGKPKSAGGRPAGPGGPKGGSRRPTRPAVAR